MIPKFLAIHQEILQASRFWDKCMGPYFSFAFVFLKHKSSFVLGGIRKLNKIGMRENGDPSGFLNISVEKYQEKIERGSFEDIKKTLRKSLTIPNKAERGDPL